MNTTEAYDEIIQAIYHNGAIEVLERMKRGVGSGAIACCEGREADEHQAERKDSREDSPGCAGVGEAVIYCEDVAAKFEQIAMDHQEDGSMGLAQFNAGVAAGWRSIAINLPLLMAKQPKPDSEARNERSGRRNSPANQPAKPD